ncbi:MAG: sugar phosphate nucleotidyltransferase [Oligoflexales bacterium]
MLHVLIPMCHKISLEPDSRDYPKILSEINGKPMVQIIIESLKASLPKDARFIFPVNHQDCELYHLDRVLKLVAGEQSVILPTQGETKGAACSSLMAVGEIPSEDPLLILNSNQVIDANISDILTDFRHQSCDAGVVCFQSVHPKWSFIKTENDLVIEAAEKRPISNQAIAGFYYFKSAKLYFESAMNMIKKDVHWQGSYFNAPVLNELVLNHKKIITHEIDAKKYFNFSDEGVIKKYRQILENR